jgi:hypothetical protein
LKVARNAESGNVKTCQTPRSNVPSQQATPFVVAGRFVSFQRILARDLAAVQHYGDTIGAFWPEEV